LPTSLPMDDKLEIDAVFIRTEDGWRFVLEFQDGTKVAYENAYPTKEEASAALDRWCEQIGATQVTVQ
jgi:hypothetical protein